MVKLKNVSAVLFDIDGTLIVGGNSHFPSLERALESVLGIPLNWAREGDRLFLNGQEISGWVDYQLFTAAAAEHGLTISTDILNQIGEAASVDMWNSWRDGGESGIPAPGAELLLSSLDEIAIPYTLSTGNVVPTALAKISKAQLGSFFNIPAYGGYGDQIDRIHVAKRAAYSLFPEGYGEKQIVLVGDTAADMRAARVNGFLGIGVAFGAGHPDDLISAGAEDIVESLDELLARFS